MAVATLGLAPSEVRAMTPAEIMSVVAAKTSAGSGNNLGEADMAELYDELMEARGECS